MYYICWKKLPVAISGVVGMMVMDKLQVIRKTLTGTVEVIRQGLINM